MKKLLAAFGLPALGLILALAACADEAPPPPPAPVNHTLPPKIGLEVQVINLTDRSGMQPVSSPYNNNHFSPTIADAIKQWASDRLQASGASGQAIIVIKDASLIEQPMPIQQSVDGWFTRQQGSKYIARAEVSIEATGHQGFAMADAIATRSVTLAENPTAVEKQDAYYSLLNGMMKDLGQNLESSIQMHMGSFIVPPQSSSMAAPTGNSYTAVGNGDFAPVIIQGTGGTQNRMTNAPAAAPQIMAPQMMGAQQQGAPQIVPLGAQMQAQMQALSTQEAVTAATVPSPAPAGAAGSTMIISQSPLAPAEPAASMMAAANSYAASGPVAVTQMPLPAPQPSMQQPQAPVFGSRTIPTVPDLGSSPDSFPPQPQAAPPPQQQAAAEPAKIAPAPPTPLPTPPPTSAPAPQTGVSYDPYTPYPAPPMPQQIPSADSLPSDAEPQPIPASSYAAYASTAHAAPATIPLSGPAYATQ